MKNFKKFFLIIGFLVLVAALILIGKKTAKAPTSNQPPQNQQEQNPLMIEVMRKQSYPGSDIKIEETLEPGSNYNRYIASYQSEGLKIYALLTVPLGDPSAGGGWPVIVFNHGYIPPEQYSPTERYVAYVDAFARDGYVVFRPDYRGNGNSEGKPEGAYYSPAYAIDDLNALASIKKLRDPSTLRQVFDREAQTESAQGSGRFVVDANRIGMWGHSMGGNITLRALEISPDIRAAVIWGGVVGSYDDLMNNWQRRVPFRPGPRELSLRNNMRANLIAKYGTPQTNQNFWNSIDPTAHLNLISAPIQLDAGSEDEEVPIDFSAKLNDKLKASGKTVEFYTYPGSDHNISQGFDLAMQRSVEFFDKYLKNQ